LVEADEQVGAVIELFRDHGFDHAPIMSNGKLIGIVSSDNIISHLLRPKNRQTLGERAGEKIPRLTIPVRSIMSTPVITAKANTPLKVADQKMHKHNISALIVTKSDRERPIGLVTRRDFLEPIAQMDYQQLKLYVQFSIKDDIKVSAIQRRQMMNDFDSFAERFGDTLVGGALFAYMKSHGSNYKGDQLIHCRLQLRTKKGAFYSNSEGWGVEQTFQLALDRLERQILRSKELEDNVEYAGTYLKRLRMVSS
jgi:CBS domain-containing protein